MEDKTNETTQAVDEGATTATDDATVQTGTDADVAKIEAAIEGLKTAGEDLFAEEITALETKKAALTGSAEVSVLDMDLSGLTLEKLQAMDEKEVAEWKAALENAVTEGKEALKTFCAYEEANTVSKWDKIKTYIANVEKYLRIGVYAYFAYLIYAFVKSLL
jgi:hypothetical protein